MKRGYCILIGLALGVAALKLCAAGSGYGAFSSMNFSNSALWGKVPKWGLDDAGNTGTQGNYHWWYTGGSGNLSVVTNYATAAEQKARYKGFNSKTNPQPSYMKSGSDNEGLLDFLTAAPLARTFKPASEDGVSSLMEIPEENGLFIDTLVRFEPRAVEPNVVPTEDVNAKAKFMCWVSVPTGSGRTNLVVTAGRFATNGELYRTNYVTTAVIDSSKWYRLTARAIANAATAADRSATCFVLYLDGVPVSCAAGDYQIGDSAAAMDTRFVGNEFYSQRALFPSIRAFNTLNPGLYGFAASGRGWYDEFGVVNEYNPLGQETETLGVTVAVETQRVAAVQCTVTSNGFETAYFKTNTTDVAEIRFDVSPGDTIRVTATAAAGYSMADELTFSGNTAALANYDGYTFTMQDGEFDDSARLVARVESGRANFRVGGQTYESLVEALEAADTHPSHLLELENDIVLDAEATTENGQMRILPFYDLTFDLKGRCIEGQHFQNEAVIYDQGRLTVIDSVGGGSIVAPGTAIEVVSTNDAVNVNHEAAALTLGSETVQNVFTVNGRVRRTQGELLILGGRYLTPHDLEPTNDFYLTEFMAPDRFTVSGPEAVPGVGNYWTVAYDGRLLVKFTAEYGTVEPTKTNVVEGALLVEPRVTYTGYSVTNWYNQSTREAWDFATDTVSESMTLVAQLGINTYDITYDVSVEKSAPTEYTVKSIRKTLPTPTKTHFTFAGWRDNNTGYFVTQVGNGAVFVGTETPVTGDLDLRAVWTAQTLTWSNAAAGDANSESNGTYAGTWTFVIPPQDGLAKGSTVKVDEIAFCIVNPLLYPKTAPYLTVTPKGASAVISSMRTNYYDAATTEYVAGAHKLANSRVRVGYGFAALEVTVGTTNSVSFAGSATESTAVKGFLRLKHQPGGDDAVFGNCTIPGGDPETDRYLEYCPVYEVTGRAVEGGVGE